MLGVLDTERGARTSGSRFVYLMGDLVFVQFALMRHAMDVVVDKGFSPMPRCWSARRRCTARASSPPTP